MGKNNYLTIILIFILFPSMVYSYSQGTSWEADKQNKIYWEEVISTYNLLWREYIVKSIPTWKYNILKSKWIINESLLLIHTLNTLECWREDWFCIAGGSTNHADAWPLQINQVNREAHLYSEQLIRERNKEQLYSFQVDWVIARIRRLDKGICKWKIWINRVRCQATHHNWNTRYQAQYGQFRYFYWEKAVRSYNKLSEYFYKNK